MRETSRGVDKKLHDNNDQKTAIAEAIANYFQVPFVRLDLSKIMGGIVGESERNARMAFEVLDSIGKTVVLIDEAEKALGGK